MSEQEYILFLTLEEVLEIHRDQIENYGGAEGIKDQGLLESALAQPETSFAGEYLHKTIFEMAAAYCFHLIENHPFYDGNKRVGIVTALIFLDFNGFEVDVDEDVLEKFTLSIASGEKSKEEIAKFFKSCSKVTNV